MDSCVYSTLQHSLTKATQGLRNNYYYPDMRIYVYIWESSKFLIAIQSTSFKYTWQSYNNVGSTKLLINNKEIHVHTP